MDAESCQTATIRGLSLKDRLPREKKVVRSDFDPIFDGIADRIADLVLSTLEKAPPEVSSDLLAHGLCLCGGASQALRVKERIAFRINLAVRVIDHPQQTVIRGLYRMLEGRVRV